MPNQALQHLNNDTQALLLRSQVEALLPAQQSYKHQHSEDAPERRLPFVKGAGKQTDFWNIPDTDDYGVSCILGQEYAAHYFQYLKDQPDCFDTLLMDIVLDMGRAGGNKGFMVGFFFYMERTLIQWVKDKPVYDQLLKDREHYIQCSIEAQKEDFDV